jgi:hypothetical protein
MKVIASIMVLGVLALAGCGSASGGTSGTEPASSSGPTGVAGLVQSFPSSDRSALTPLPGAKVGVYTKQFPVIGPPRADGPSPIATAATDSDGRFEVDGLAPGRYFVVAATASHWMDVTDGNVTTARFAICHDCPVPL